MISLLQNTRAGTCCRARSFPDSFPWLRSLPDSACLTCDVTLMSDRHSFLCLCLRACLPRDVTLTSDWHSFVCLGLRVNPHQISHLWCMFTYASRVKGQNRYPISSKSLYSKMVLSETSYQNKSTSTKVHICASIFSPPQYICHTCYFSRVLPKTAKELY